MFHWTKTTEPYHQHQNEAQKGIQTAKQVSNKVMDRTGAPDYLWLRAVIYTCMLLNVMACRSLDWRTLMKVRLGITPDNFEFTDYTFSEPVYYIDLTPEGYPDTVEKIEHWCGPTEYCVDVLTAWVLTQYTKQLLARSVLRSAVPEENSTALVPVNF